MAESKLEVFISKDDIAKRVSELGKQITSDFNNEELVVICILNGSFMFCADLVREIDLPMQVEFMKCSSYGNNTESTGNVKIKLDLSYDIKGKNVLVVEDIVDTGYTMRDVLHMLETRGAKTLKVASLLFKPARNEVKVPIDYLGFEIEDKFVIGYGLDYAGNYRELPYIGVYQGD